MQALVSPVRLQKLTIQPVNLLVSIHASLKLYIASDHTPLSFSLFERGPLCTTARQLVHALAMHYAAGALFRAGRSWTEGHTHTAFLSRSNATYSPLATSLTTYGKWFCKPAWVSYSLNRVRMLHTHYLQRDNRLCAWVRNSIIYSLLSLGLSFWDDCYHELQGLPLLCGRKCSRTISHQKLSGWKPPKKDFDSPLIVIYCFVIRFDSLLHTLRVGRMLCLKRERPAALSLTYQAL